MSFDLAGKKWITLSDQIYIGSHKIQEIYVGNHKVYPEGGTIYYSYNNAQYVLDIETSTWSRKNWGGVNLDAYYIWSDGINIYYSNGDSQYVLDAETSTWRVKTWNGLNWFFGNYIWTDGTNIYYSNHSDGDNVQHYILDISSSTWISTSWEGILYIDEDTGEEYWTDEYPFRGEDVWTDGVNYYANDVLLDFANHACIEKTWEADSRYGRPSGVDAWTDGHNIYFSYLEYVQGPPHTWIRHGYTLTTVTWNNVSPRGHWIWSDGTNIYYSNGGTYVFDKSNSTWSTKSWNGLTSFDGRFIWSPDIKRGRISGNQTTFRR